MIERLSKNWWLLAFCGVLDGTIAWLFFGESGRGFRSMQDILLLARIMVAAGVCSIAAGIWAEKGQSWLLAVHGVACSGLGLILSLWRGPLQFRTIALLIFVMAVSLGAYELARARRLRNEQVAAGWLLGVAGALAFGFTLVFLGFALHWIRLAPASPGESLDWLGSFFAFSAVSMLGLALRPGLRSVAGETLPAL